MCFETDNEYFFKNKKENYLFQNESKSKTNVSPEFQRVTTEKRKLIHYSQRQEWPCFLKSYKDVKPEAVDVGLSLRAILIKVVVGK